MRFSLALRSSIVLVATASCATSGTEPTVTPGDASTSDGPAEVAPDVAVDGTSDEGFVVDAVPLDAPPEGIARVFANTDDDLWIMDPKTKDVTKVGPFTGVDTASGEAVTDIAVDEAGRLFAVSTGGSGKPGHVFELVLPSGGTGTVVAKPKRTLPPTPRFYALAFAPKGVLGADETLVGGDSGGDLWIIPTDGSAPLNVGGFGKVQTGDPGSGNVGDAWQLSGDLVFFSNAGSPIGLATLRPCATTCKTDDDVLVEIDMVALAKKSSSSLLRKRFVGKGTGYGRLFGVGAWDDQVYAFQRYSASTTSPNPARLIAISLATGVASVVRDFAEITSAKNGWSGAGVTTSAKISVPK